MGSEHLQDMGGSRVWRSLALILTVLTVSAFGETTPSSMHNLRTHLFANYDKLIRPVANHRTVTTVNLGLTPLALRKLDEDKQILEMDAWMYMRWSDEYLVWNPDDFDGIKSLNIPSTEIWRPDITFYTGSPVNKMVIEVLTNAIVNNTGDVLWVPPVNIHSACPELGSSQGDSATCVIKIGSWTQHEYMVDLQLKEDQVRMEHFQNTNPIWDLTSFTSERHSKLYSCCKEPYPEVDFKVTMRRRSTGRCCPKCSMARHSHMSHHHCPYMSSMGNDGHF